MPHYYETEIPRAHGILQEALIIASYDMIFGLKVKQRFDQTLKIS